MASRSRSAVNIWPGFVDALATLLLVFIFMLVVFILAQFHLNDALSKRKTALERLNTRIHALTNELSEANSELTALRGQKDERQAKLEQAVTRAAQYAFKTNRLRTRLDETLLDVERKEDELARRLRETARLQQQINALRALRDEQENRLAGLIKALEQNRALNTTLQQRSETLVEELGQAEQRIEDDTQTLAERAQAASELQARLEHEQAQRADLQQRLEQTLADSRLEKQNLQTTLDETLASVEAGRETIELRLREIASLKDDIAALQLIRDELEREVGKLAVELEHRDGEIGAERERSKALEARLAEAEELTRLAQQALEQRDIRLQELSARISEPDTSVDDLSKQLQTSLDELDALKSELATALARAEQAELEARLRKAALAKARSEVTEYEQAKEQLLFEALDLSTTITALENQRDALQQRLTTLGEELDGKQDETREAREQVTRLNQDIMGLYNQNELLSRMLRQNDTIIESKEEEIVYLKHLLQRSRQLSDGQFGGYRSEFFSRLRQVLGERPDIRVVGDRFLFQSELLFGSASARLGADGKRQLDQVAAALKEIAARIPADINWVLQVNGHTDKRPISTAQFPSNWELSAARAISIVRYLMEQGIPAQRLAATGFAEYYPIDPADSKAAYSRNRRIELKLTSR